jgi:hypothetical protein
MMSKKDVIYHFENNIPINYGGLTWKILKVNPKTATIALADDSPGVYSKHIRFKLLKPGAYKRPLFLEQFCKENNDADKRPSFPEQFYKENDDADKSD